MRAMGLVEPGSPAPPPAGYFIAARTQTVGSGSSGFTITLPTGAMAGDLMLITWGAGGGSGPAGWSNITISYGGTGSITWKVLSSGDITTGTVSCTLSSGATKAIIAAIYRVPTSVAFKTYNYSFGVTGTTLGFTKSGSFKTCLSWLWIEHFGGGTTPPLSAPSGFTSNAFLETTDDNNSLAENPSYTSGTSVSWSTTGSTNKVVGLLELT